MRNINLRYVDEAYDENGLLTKFDITMPDNFNFAYDVVDDIAINDPERTAMVWCNPEGEEHTFTFADMKTWSDKTANFMADCGIGRGDFVMVILRRHYQFWFTMLALEKLGAVAVPATFMLKEHDLTYRLNGADIKAIIATSAGDIAVTIDAVVEECPSVETLILVNPAGAGLTPRDEDGNWVAPAGELVGEALSGPAGICAAPVAREGWRDFNSEVRAASADFTRRETAGADPMLMYFSSGTSGNPKMVLHDSGYALAHLITAKHWHNVNPEGLHFTIADTGWGKAVWGKYFGQWLMEAAVLTYDFDRYDPAEILSLVGRYGVTTLCCPPTMYRLMSRGGRGRLRPVQLGVLHHGRRSAEPRSVRLLARAYRPYHLRGLRPDGDPAHRGQPHELHAAPGLHGQAGADVRHEDPARGRHRVRHRRDRRDLHRHRTRIRPAS